MIRHAFRLTLVTLLFSIFSLTVRANGIPVIYQPLSPSSVAPGGVGFSLTVSGTGFTSSAVVNWNGSPRTTTYISSSQLSASILASDIANAVTAVITVTNPGSGGGTSNQIPFQVVTTTVGLGFQDTILASDFSGGTLLSPVVGDFNGDGVPDVAVGSTIGNTIHIFFGNGDGTFQQGVSLVAAPAGGQILDLALGDVNGDGKADLIASYNYINVSNGSIIGKAVLLQNGDGTFQAPKFTDNFSNGTSSVVADVNGDGKADLIAACGPGVCLGLSNGDGTFTPSVVFTSPVNIQSGGPKVGSVAVGDFNGDGKLDIAFVAFPLYLAVIFGNGDGTFSTPSLVYDTGVGGADAAVAADFNGDGILDLAFYYGQNVQPPNNFALSIFLGNGDGSFQEPITLSGLPFNEGAPFVAGDFNGDGHLDLAIASLAVLIGNGNGIFSHTQIPLPHSASSAADFNGDGKLDFIGVDSSNNIHVILQTPPQPDFSGSVNPAFQSVVNGSAANYSVSISSIDGFAGSVQFSISGLPAGAMGGFSPPTITGSGTTSLTISTLNSTPTGSYTITVTGTSGSMVHSGTLTLNVGPANTDFTDFQGSITPAYQTIVPGSSTRFDLGVSPVNGFNGTVSFSVSGLPAGATATFVPATVSGGSGTALLNVSTLASTPTGSYPLVVTGTSGAHVHSTIVNLNVGPAGTDFTDFTGFITPASQSVAIGGSASFTMTVMPINGFSDSLLLSQVGTPSGVSILASSDSIQGGSGSVIVTFSPGPTAVPGTYTITITARGASNVSHIHSKSITLTITP